MKQISHEIRSRMTSTAFGVSAPETDLCAVENCEEPGRPHVCPFDFRYHRHGCIHYREGDRSGLAYRDDAWHWMCDGHYQAVVEAYK